MGATWTNVHMIRVVLHASKGIILTEVAVTNASQGWPAVLSAKLGQSVMLVLMIG